MKKIKIISLVVMLSIVAGLMPPAVRAEENSSGYAEGELPDYRTGDDSYLYYQELYRNEELPEAEAALSSDSAVSLENAQTGEEEGREYILLNEGGSAAWTVQIDEGGLYAIRIRYKTVPGKNSNMELALYLDGELPFFEAGYLTLFRKYKDTALPGELKDANDNDISIPQEEVFDWQESMIQDYSGVYSEPYRFYLDAGTHEIRLESTRESVIIESLTLLNPEEAPSYEEAALVWEQEGLENYQGELLVIEAENALYKSDSILYGRNDRSSPDTTPYSPSKIRINTIGGGSFNSAGQWIEWEVEASEDGLYYFGMRARQNLVSGSFATRELRVNGELLFQEAAQIEVSYDMDWQCVIFPYRIPLKEGINTIRLTVTPGRLSSIISIVEQSLYELNDAYREVVMITGAEPDPYRDYMLESIIPGCFDTFREQAEILRQADEELLAMTGRRGSMNGILQSFSNMLEEFCEDTEEVQRRVGAFRDNIIALGTWLLDIKNNPLEIDKLYFAAETEQIPEANSGILRRLWHELQVFAYSFIEDYSLIGGDEDAENSITVWVQAGRDQANILKEMITNDFSPETGISVTLNLVQGQLLAATVSGQGPDVALQVGIGEPVNYALRNAAMPLDEFEGFEEVADRFRDSAMVPLTLEGVCYGLPETQTFPVMFYRVDIFDELGLEVPETWEEVFKVVGKLQKNNMEMGVLPPSSAVGASNGLTSMAMFLYQNGGEFYTDGNTRSGLGTDEAIAAFQTWVSLYTDYSLPVQYDAITRFRTGEMPIIIDDFSLYNNFSVLAPEIRGLWSFAPVPGTVQEDGSVDHSVGSTGTASMILRETGNPEGAWQFLEWWSRADTQAEYGRRLENQLGPSARYAAACVEAFNQINWPTQDLARLNSQWENVKGIPEVAGGYFTSRHINNAFRRVYNYGEDAKETLLDYVQVIDEEIAYKRREVGLTD